MLTENQQKAIVDKVVEKVNSMVENRVKAREGSVADQKKVKAEIAKQISK